MIFSPTFSVERDFPGGIETNHMICDGQMSPKDINPSSVVQFHPLIA